MDEAEARAEELRTEVERVKKDLMRDLRKNSTEAGDQGRLSAAELRIEAHEQALMKLTELLQMQSESLDLKADQMLTSNQMLEKSMDQSLSAAVRNLLPEIRSMIGSTTSLLNDELAKGKNTLDQAVEGFRTATVKFNKLTQRRDRFDRLVGLAACATVLLVLWHFAAMQRFFNYNFYLFWWLTALVIGVMLLYVGGFFGSLWNRFFLR